MQQLVDEAISPADWVYADWSAYYALKRRSAELFLPVYAEVISDEERHRISAIVVPPNQLPGAIDAVGGTWRDTGAALQPLDPGLLGSPALPDYDLHVYRRAEPSQAPERPREAAFTLHLYPSTQTTVPLLGSAAYTVSMKALNGFHALVYLSVTGLPGRATASFSRNVVNPGTDSTLTIETGWFTAAGKYELTVLAESVDGTAIKSAHVIFVVS